MNGNQMVMQSPLGQSMSLNRNMMGAPPGNPFPLGTGLGLRNRMQHDSNVDMMLPEVNASPPPPKGLLHLLKGLLHLLESLHHLLESLHHLLKGLLLYLHLVELHPLLGGHLGSKGGGFHNTATSRPNRKRKNAGRRTEITKILRPRISMKTWTE